MVNLETRYIFSCIRYYQKNNKRTGFSNFKNKIRVFLKDNEMKSHPKINMNMAVKLLTY